MGREIFFEEDLIKSKAVAGTKSFSVSTAVLTVTIDLGLNAKDSAFLEGMEISVTALSTITDTVGMLKFTEETTDTLLLKIVTPS